MPSALIAAAQLHVRLVVEHALGGLADAGVGLLSAADGAAALAIVHEQRPELVVLDGVLEGPSAIEVCRTIKVELGLDSVAVALLAGPGLDRAAAEAAGADTILPMPFDPDELRSVAARATGRTAEEPKDAAAEPDLAWLIRHDRHLAPVLSVLLGAMDAAITIQGPEGAPIVERAGAGSGGERVAIQSGGRTLGWVSGNKSARAIAALLAYAADRDAERRSLVSEALTRYAELNAAGRVGSGAD